MSSLSPAVPLRLRVDSNYEQGYGRPTLDLSEDVSLSPKTPQSQAALAFRVSTSPLDKQAPGISRSQPSQKTSKNRVRDESRKLISHVLLQLQNRALPPPVFDAATTPWNNPSNKGVAEAVKGAVKLGIGQAKVQAQFLPGEEDEEEDRDRVFSTDSTLELMTQLKDVLIISIAQGWLIFDDEYGIDCIPHCI